MTSLGASSISPPSTAITWPRTGSRSSTFLRVQTESRQRPTTSARSFQTRSRLARGTGLAGSRQRPNPRLLLAGAWPRRPAAGYVCWDGGGRRRPPQQKRKSLGGNLIFPFPTTASWLERPQVRGVLRQAGIRAWASAVSGRPAVWGERRRAPGHGHLASSGAG